MSYLIAEKDEEYLEAISATEFLGIPAEGFRRVGDELTSSKGIQVAVKQNNSVIYLLVKTLKKLEELETKVSRIEKSLLIASKENPQFQESLEKLIQEVNRIKITDKGVTPPPAVTRKSYYFRNPQEIFNSVKSKSQ